MTPFNRDEVAGLFTRHFELLCSMAYIDRSRIRYPPIGGWSEEDVPSDFFRSLNPPRSETVIDLLRHLPYLETGTWPDEVFFNPRDTPHDYLRNGRLMETYDAPRDQLSGKSLGELFLMPFDEYAPPRLVMLAYGPIGAVESWSVLDTEENNIYLCNFWYENENENIGEEAWKSNNPESVQKVFNDMHEKLMTLDWVPLPRTKQQEVEIVPYNDDETDAFRAVYRDCGWPDAFRREECVARLVTLREGRQQEAVEATQRVVAETLGQIRR
ncbi:Hypothetical protein D9617_20g027120 [Elsinoe fawcettii]|nr:Hypothetical protein D9617_20g027120 [Elsinoe fawcettii]